MGWLEIWPSKSPAHADALLALNQMKWEDLVNTWEKSKDLKEKLLQG